MQVWKDLTGHQVITRHEPDGGSTRHFDQDWGYPWLTLCGRYYGATIQVLGPKVGPDCRSCQAIAITRRLTAR